MRPGDRQNGVSQGTGEGERATRGGVSLLFLWSVGQASQGMPSSSRVYRRWNRATSFNIPRVPESDGTTVLVAALVEPSCDLGEPPPVFDLPSLFGKDALALPRE